MPSTAALADAKSKLDWMISKEMRGPGDAGSALARLVRRHRLKSSPVKTLLYSSPKDIYLSVYLSICSAYEAEVARWERQFIHERAIAKARTGLGKALLRLADNMDSLAGQGGSPEDSDVGDEDGREGLE